MASLEEYLEGPLDYGDRKESLPEHLPTLVEEPSESKDNPQGLNESNENTPHPERTPEPLDTVTEEPSDLKNPDEVLMPTNLKAEIAANEILLSWGPPMGLSKHQVSYEVEWKKITDSQWTKAVTREQKYLLTNLAPETDYDMKVSAYEKILNPEEPADEKQEQEKEKELFEHMTLFPENSTISQAGSEVEAFTQRTKELSKLVAELERTLEYQKRLNKGEKIPKGLESKINADLLKPVRRKNCPKRILFIIMNEMFARSPQLRAASRLQSEITRLFERDWKGEGDHVKKIKNGTRAQILNELDKLRQRLDFDSHKMFICIILSYGTVEGFRTMDEEMIEYQELFAMLNGTNWIHFSEKPKMFFIDVHPIKLERTGQYPQDIHVNEVSEDELEVRWKPPKLFQNSPLNYLVHCYKINEQKIHTKTHELIAKKTSCVLDKMQKDVMYKISIWSLQATTQKKRGLPSQTKYTIKERAPDSQKLTAKSTTYDTITIYWPLPMEGRTPPYIAKYKEKGTDTFKRTELLPIESEESQAHILNFLKSNTEYIIRIFAGRSRILNEVKIKTLPKHQPKELRAKHITPFEIELTWEPPSVNLRSRYKYHISYQMKNSSENTLLTNEEDYTLNELIPDVVYTIWVTAEKDGLKGDPTDPIQCHTPRCGPQNLQVDAHERSIRVYWDEAIVPAETESLTYRVRLLNENIRPIVGEVLPTTDAKYEYACYLRDLWTDTHYNLVITTVIDEGDWDPPTEQEIKTRRDSHMSDLEPHDNNFLIAYSNTLGIEVGEKKQGGIFLPTVLELLRDYYDTKNIVEIMEIVEDEVQIRSSVTGRIRKVITVNTLLSRPNF